VGNGESKGVGGVGEEREAGRNGHGGECGFLQRNMRATIGMRCVYKLRFHNIGGEFQVPC
jgi:hypothetical protein